MQNSAPEYSTRVKKLRKLLHFRVTLSGSTIFALLYAVFQTRIQWRF